MVINSTELYTLEIKINKTLNKTGARDGWPARGFVARGGPPTRAPAYLRIRPCFSVSP